jgi:hypothetical protein
MPRKTINPRNGETLKIDGVVSSVQFRRHKRKGRGSRIAVTINTPGGIVVERRKNQRIRD